jgi:DNA-binding NarL/FixJ family response regulator
MLGDNPNAMITVLLADDHALHRRGVRALLRGQPDIEVVAEAHNGWEAVELSKLHHPAVVVMDLQMPVMNGLEATRRVCGLLPGVKVLMLSSAAEPGAAMAATRAGAAAFVAKPAKPRALPDLIRDLVRDAHPPPPAATPAVAAHES